MSDASVNWEDPVYKVNKNGATSHVFYQPDKPTHVINAVFRRQDGDLAGLYSRKTSDELVAEYPGMLIGTVEEFKAFQNEALRTDPEEITEERYWEMLEVLPPLNWRGTAGYESFMLSEFWCGDITTIYANRGSRYFTFKDVSTLSHKEIMARLPV
ncbi:MAG: DUF1419 domain-containing protein [Azoarcus sp.]|jgi:hypothetical protein|nr:DUF1419 domain-containing protein [Azoarcus sp.]